MMDKRLTSVALSLTVTLIIFAAVVLVLGNALGLARFQTNNATLALRFGFVILGLLIVFAVYWATRDNAAWEVGTRQVVWMAIGAALYAVFSFLFNGTVFVVPSLSQVSLRPAIAIPMFFGYAFGPVVGFFTGAVGNMFGDALTGFGLSPQWSIGNGLVGFIAGLALLFRDKKRSADTVLLISAALVVITVALFLFNRNEQNQLYFAAQESTSVLVGLTLVIGLILVAVERYFPAYFPPVLGFFLGGIVFGAIALGFGASPLITGIVAVIAGVIGAVVGARYGKGMEHNPDVMAAVIWGMLGNILGILFAALSDIWINGFSLAAAVVGEFLPAAGPNLIFAAILVPLLVAAYAAVQRQSGR